MAPRHARQGRNGEEEADEPSGSSAGEADAALASQRALGEALREAREAAGMSQVVAAQRLGVSSLTVSRWERGVQRVKARDVAALDRLYGSRLVGAMHGAAQNVARGTASQAREVGGSYGAGVAGEDWAPNPALARSVPPRAYEIALSFCRRMAAAGVPADQVEAAERLMLDSRYAKANSRAGRGLSEGDWILLIEDTWDAIRETYSFQGVIL